MGTIITDEVTAVDSAIADGRLLIDQADLPLAVGWELKPEGLCRDHVCLPVRDRSTLLVGDRVDVGAVASALGRPSVVDAHASIAAIAFSSEPRRTALTEQHAPEFALPDLDGAMHSLEEWRDRKKLLIAFATW